MIIEASRASASLDQCKARLIDGRFKKLEAYYEKEEEVI